jgi:deoxyadenosine/deoxycytidine kinase
MPLSKEGELPKEKENIYHYPLFGLVGPMGSGKSQLAKLISNYLSVPDYKIMWFREKFLGNPFLKRFYDDPSQSGISFKYETCFLSTKAEQLKKVAPILQQKSVIVDPSFEGDKIFAKAQEEMGWMTKEEYKTYTLLSDTYKDHYEIPDPDIFIVVNATPDVIIERIRKRGRKFEQSFLERYPDYFVKLSDLSDRFCREPQNKKPVIRIDSGKIDFINRPDGKWQVVKEIGDWLGYYSRNLNGNDEEWNNLKLPNFI